MIELWDLYDINRNKLGKTIQRGEALKQGEYHLVVHVCLFNSQGEMLIQQRQSVKKGWPNLWDVTCGGSATLGETSQEAIARELQEELGITYDFTGIRPNFTINFKNGFDDYYLIELDVDLNDISLQYEEVQQVQWASEEDILTMIKTGEFIPFYESLIHLLFDSRNHYGTVPLIADF